MKVEQMRKAILEGIKMDVFVKQPFSMVPGAPQFPGSVYPSGEPRAVLCSWKRDDVLLRSAAKFHCESGMPFRGPGMPGGGPPGMRGGFQPPLGAGRGGVGRGRGILGEFRAHSLSEREPRPYAICCGEIKMFSPIPGRVSCRWGFCGSGHSPVDSRGGQLQIAGVVVGNWGANTHGGGGHRGGGRQSNVGPPQVTSVGPRR